MMKINSLMELICGALCSIRRKNSGLIIKSYRPSLKRSKKSLKSSSLGWLGMIQKRGSTSMISKLVHGIMALSMINKIWTGL